MCIPASTYRIQFNKEFTFSDLEEQIDYLHALGISTIYASPVFTATAGSTHGYDVTDPHSINPEIGSMEQLEQINKKLREKNMSWLQDIVPNHMSFVPENKRLYDVMERGSKSDYYNYFDINWNHHNPLLKNKLMTPFLGDDLEKCIERNEVNLEFGNSGFVVNYSGTKYPLSASAFELLAHYLNEEEKDSSSGLPSSLSHFHSMATSDLTLQQWNDFKTSWLSSSDENEINKLVYTINNDKPFLTRILHNQHYYLCNWINTEREINYRRFFTVNSLICLAMEKQEVYDEYHQFIQSLCEKEMINGLRIDHIDGLNDPKEYIERLRSSVGNDMYIVAEKILEAEEIIPSDWKLHGTSGYEFLAFVSQLFTDSNGAEKLHGVYERFTGVHINYRDLVFEKKLHILRNHMFGEFTNLLHYMDELKILNGGRTASECVSGGLELLMAAFPVYRIYPGAFPIENMEIVEDAFVFAEHKGPELKKEFEILRRLFNNDHISTEESENRITFLKRFMQFTGPLAAKGVEDTSFYLYNPLISHNEVGDSPSRLGITIENFHERMSARRLNTPYSINTTSTHDTKRGEDARLRINLISEMPDEWEELIQRWKEMNRHLKTTINGREVPSANEEFFIYQALLGSFPESGKADKKFIERFLEYYTKVLREAKENTGWAKPSVEYEEACHRFIIGILNTEHGFIQVFLPFLIKVFKTASDYSCAQTLIKITAPGIPDIYQGSELWDLSLVDPDNRRPVDYAIRKQYLKEFHSRETDRKELLDFVNRNQDAGAHKLFINYIGLNYRKSNTDLFTIGEYIPLTVTSGNGIAYARHYKNDWALVVVPLRYATSEAGSIRIHLPQNAPQQWKDMFTGKTQTISGDTDFSDFRNRFPVVFLTASELTL